MKEGVFNYNNTFELELGGSLPEISIAYTTFGTINTEKSNVVWVFHALTANQNPYEWWPGLFGEKDYFNSKEYFIVCANVLGGCYGSTGPNHSKVPTDLQYGNFPLISIRDIVKAHHLLKSHLNISKIHMAIGGSFGGYQAMEFAVDNQDLENLVLIATATKEKVWNIGIHESQRMAIESDINFNIDNDLATKGLETARAIGMLTYRTLSSFDLQQPRGENQTKNFKVSSYLRYQGEKLSKRFSPWCYHKLTQTLDTHDLSRDRISLEKACNKIKAKTLLIGIDEDLLASAEDMKQSSNYFENGIYESMSSRFGHDGFLIETEKIKSIINQHIPKP